MKHTKKACVLLLASMAAMQLSACDKVEEEATYNWVVSSGLAVGTSWDLALHEWADLLYEASEGDIKLQVYSGSVLGSAKEVLEGLQIGSIDFMVESASSFSNFSDALNVFDLPYLFPNEVVAREVLGSPAATAQLDALSADGFKGINFWENGIYAIGTTPDKPVETLDDLQGLRIRSIDSILQTSTYAALGANGVVLSWGDIYTSAQSGVVDGVSSTTVPNMFSANFYEVAPNITLSNHGYSAAPLVMSQKVWDGLPVDIQQIIMDTAAEARLFQYETCDRLMEECVTTMEENGATFIEIDIAEWTDAVSPVYEAYVGKNGIDAEVVADIKAEVDKVWQG